MFCSSSKGHEFTFPLFKTLIFSNYSAIRHLLCVDDPSAEVCKFSDTGIVSSLNWKQINKIRMVM